MSGYDGRRFAKVFSERTQRNLEYIQRITVQNQNQPRYRDEFKAKCESLLFKAEDILNEVRKMAFTIPSRNTRGGNGQRSSMYSHANTFQTLLNELKEEYDCLPDSESIQRERTYEVTQLLNSLMGIAVLPYEMYKEYFREVPGMENSRRERQNSLMRDAAYQDMEDYVNKLYCDGKWYSTYSGELENDEVCRRIVYAFLRHIRNAVCHSGDNAISILPLNDGTEINRILFYDKLDRQEFAMELSVEDLEELVRRIGSFYCGTDLGMIDKSENLRKVENRVLGLLKKNRYRNYNKITGSN